MLRLLARTLGWLAWSVAALTLAAWIFSRAVTDRWLASQFLFWIPSFVYLALAAALTPLAQLIRLRRRDGSILAGPRRCSNLLVLVFAAALAFTAHRELRLFNLLRPPAPAAPGHALRVLHWNALYFNSAGFNAPFTDFVPAPAPDVVFTSTLQSDEAFMRSLAAFGPGYTLHRHGPFVVASRIPVLRESFFDFNLAGFGASPAAEPDLVDPALARSGRRRLEHIWNTWADTLGIGRREFSKDENASLFVLRLDTTATLGRPTTIWYVDLPSDPFLLRWETATHYRQHLDNLAELRDTTTNEPVVPPADIVLGDFNTPRGSASLRLITGDDMTNAFDQAGAGFAASWPRGHPLFHIDHIFLAPWLRAAGYRLVKPPVADHDAQVADITTR